MQKIIGRKKEIEMLNQVLLSNKAEFVAIYGRRRIGKTYLIQQHLANKGIYFECTGIKDGAMKDQLKNFTSSFQKTFYPTLSLKITKDWRESFTMLTSKLKELPKTKKIILFFDELPWLATRKSMFLQELDYFWNTEWSKLSNLKLIVCGSAASWILENLINAKGGLHNRLTQSILLEPFSLGETKEFLEMMDIKLKSMQILDLYMIMGGVPFYLNKLQKNKSIAQNINDLCFTKDGILHTEFTRLFKSLFDSYEINFQIIRAIAKFRYGISFKQLLEKVGKKAGSRFANRLNELEAAGFIQKLLPYGKQSRDHYYRIKDEYTMFYLKWIENTVGKIPKGTNYWLSILNSQKWNSWAGCAFEIVCHKHEYKIIHALELNNIGCLVGNWKYIPAKNEESQGAQIDLLFDREDNAITICEIKYSAKPFAIDKAYANNLLNKKETFKNHAKVDKELFICLITTRGMVKNYWSERIVNKVVVLEQLF